MAVRIVFPSASQSGGFIVDAELSFSDGSVVTGTADIFTGLDGLSVPNSSHPVNFMKIGNKLVFQVTDNAHGRELWVTDGTVAGTEFLVDINTVAPTDTHNSTERTSSWQFSQESVFKFQAPAVFDGFTYFKADDGVNGIELWRTGSGPVLGTTLVANINPGVNGSSPFLLTASGDFLYFAATTQANGTELWKTDGTTTEIVANLVAGNGNSNPDNLTDFNGTLFFTAASKSGGPSHLWQTTGGAPTQISGADFTSQLTPLGNLLLFNKADNANGAELWVYDGTTAHIVKNIATTPVPPGPNTDFGSNPQNLAAFNGFVYFWAQDDTHGFEVWRSDGTADGTTLFADINTTGPNVSSGPGSPFVVSGNKLYFLANNGFTGQELWVTDGVDGTSAHTHIVKDIISTGTTSSFAGNTFPHMTDIDGTLYFTINDNTANGLLSLYKTDGTAPNTVAVAEHVYFPGNSVNPFAFLLTGPVVDLSGTDAGIDFTAAGFTENGAAVAIADSDATLTGSSDITSVTITIINVKTDDVLSVSGALPAGISNGGFTGGVLTLTGTASLAAYETAIKQVIFSSTSENPDTSARTISVTATDADSATNNPLPVATVGVTAVNDAPVLNANTGTAVNEGAGTTILNAQLDFNDPEQSDAQITYTVTSLTANGTLFRNAVALGVGGTFTQADIVGNLLTYTHNGSETVSDSFGFSVSDGIAPAITGQTFAITVTPQNDPPVLGANTGTAVNEGAGTTILNAQLDFNDPDNSNAQITYTLTSLTANGALFGNGVALGLGGTFTQADIVGNLLTYTHNGSETTSNSFGFSVSDGIAPAITGQTFAITVSPQNDAPVLSANTGTTVNEGAGTTILNAQLDFNDPEQSDAQITYTVTSLTANGTLFRNAVALGVGGTFTQADIVGNLLTYTHNGSETVRQFVRLLGERRHRTGDHRADLRHHGDAAE